MKGQQLFDHKKIDINLGRLKTHGNVFEVVVDPNLAIRFRNGENVDIEDTLKAQEVFHDANKGLLAPEEEVKAAFGTNDPIEVAKKILKEGEIQLTSEYREKTRAQKKIKIIAIIQRNAIDPKTGMPHPITRIENAFAESKIHIDYFKKAEDQVNDIVKKLVSVLPIRFAQKTLQVIIPAEHATKIYGKVQNLGQIKKEEWLNDGSWHAEIEIPAGLQNEVIDEINKETHGNADIKIR